MPPLLCTLKQLPIHQWVPAAAVAVKINPANAPAVELYAQTSGAPLGRENIAALTSKYWHTNGVHLTVSFLDNPDQTTRNKILLHMNAWGSKANVKFVETAGVGQVRIARAADGYWSYLGTDILTVPANQATMNLEAFSAVDTPDSEFYRVVRHETGHTLGFPHEHMRQAIVSRIDPAKAITFFAQTQGWDAQTVQQQVLTPIPETQLTALAPDQLSIMCYQLPGSITYDGQPIIGGADIDAEDYQLAAQLYPLALAPPPPPPPPPPLGPPITLTDAINLLNFGFWRLEVSNPPMYAFLVSCNRYIVAIFKQRFPAMTEHALAPEMAQQMKAMPWGSIAAALNVLRAILAAGGGKEKVDAWIAASSLPPLAKLILTGLADALLAAQASPVQRTSPMPVSVSRKLDMALAKIDALSAWAGVDESPASGMTEADVADVTARINEQAAALENIGVPPVPAA